MGKQLLVSGVESSYNMRLFFSTHKFDREERLIIGV